MYDNFFCTINGWYNPEDKINVHSLVHLSGGSFESKFAKDILFPLGLSGDIDSPWELPDIMRICAETGTSAGKIDDGTLYKTFNGGQGALAVIDEKDELGFISKASSFGLFAKVGGVITEDCNPSLRLKSAFSGKDIIYT